MRLGVLVSGRGSNLEAVLEARPAGIDPVLVVSNRPGVRALAVAARFGVPARVMALADFGDPARRDAAIGQALLEADVELALLAGYDQLLRGPFFERYGGRTINIHPSLLPAHGGRGMVGDAVHAAVLEAGERRTGVTIHEVTRELDAGPVLVQRAVPVHPGDDVGTLAERVLAVEHRLLVQTLARLAAEDSGMRSATMTGASAHARA